MKRTHTKIKSILLYNLFFVIAAIGFYFLIPIMFNYPPNSINTEFEKSIDGGMTYDSQYFMIIAFAMIVFNIIFIKQIHSVNKYKKYINKDDEESVKEINKIKKKCFSAPYVIYLGLATCPSIIIAVILLLTGAGYSLTARIGLLIFIFTLVLGLLAYVSSRKIFNEVLIELKNREKSKKFLNINFNKKIFLLFFPLVFAAILFSTFATNTLLTRERGEVIFKKYQSELELIDIDEKETLETLILKLEKIKKHSENDSLYIISEKGIMYIEKQKHYGNIDEFFIKYTFAQLDAGRTYGYYASPIQGAYIMCEIDGEKCAAGVMYSTDSFEYFEFLFYSVVILLVICVLFLWNFSNDIGNQIIVVSDNMRKIANKESIDYEQKMPVLTNDEIGDLVVSFNKILDLEKKHAESMARNQEIIVEQERLSSLGQMIGGIAHNLKTPIMSISGASQALKDLMTEYEMSIGNNQVTIEDHYEIAKEMNEWNNKIKIYLEYMTEIIDAAKGQAVTMNASNITEFSIKDLVARVKILMKEQLMHRNCELNTNIELPDNTYITGEISALVQVLNNLIVNAIDAYNGKQGIINLNVFERDEKICISVEDYAGGISEEVQKKLFKQMITTKGKAGTGLGLYMCYSTIKGKFNGEMYFETDEGIGTRFIIIIPPKTNK